MYDIFTGSVGGAEHLFMLQPHFEAATENAIICCAWEYQYKRIAQGTMNPATGGVIRWKWDYGYRGDIQNQFYFWRSSDSGTRSQDLHARGFGNKLEARTTDFYGHTYITNSRSCMATCPLVLNTLY